MGTLSDILHGLYFHSFIAKGGSSSKDTGGPEEIYIFDTTSTF